MEPVYHPFCFRSEPRGSDLFAWEDRYVKCRGSRAVDTHAARLRLGAKWRRSSPRAPSSGTSRTRPQVRCFATPYGRAYTALLVSTRVRGNTKSASRTPLRTWCPFREQLPGLGNVLIVVHAHVVGEDETTLGRSEACASPWLSPEHPSARKAARHTMMPHTRKGLLTRNPSLPSQAGATVTAGKPSLPSLLRGCALAEE